MFLFKAYIKAVCGSYCGLGGAGRPTIPGVTLTDHPKGDDQQVNQVVLLTAGFRGDVALVEDRSEVLHLPLLEVLPREVARGQDVALLTLTVRSLHILLELHHTVGTKIPATVLTQLL